MMKYIVCIAAACSLLACSKKSSTTATPATTVVKMATDGTNQAAVLQQAIKTCNAAGGGIVEVPAGTYVIGPITMLSSVTLQIDTLATLKGTGVISDYTLADGSVVDQIGASKAVNVSITGKGIIDGNGAPWWAAFDADNSISRPRLVYFKGCSGVKLDGVTLQNSPSFHFVPSQCATVSVNNVKIYAPSNSPNTDGIDPANSTTVAITKCKIDVGDDCIAIKGGRVSGKLGYPTTGITVTDCTFLNGHGLSIGSEIDCGVSNVTVSNCTFTGTTNGIRIKSNIGLGGPASSLSYSNITMTNVANPLIINFIYSSNTGNNATDIPSVAGLTIDHLTVTGANNAGSLVGLANTNNSVANVTLSNINITAKTGLVISNATNVTMSNYTINVTSGNNIIGTNILGQTGF